MKIHDYARTGDIAGVLAELEQGVDIEARDDNGDSYEYYTPLMWATVSSNAGADMVAALIERGANVNAEVIEVDEIPGYGKFKHIRSVLCMAIQAYHREKVELLLGAGADLHYKHEDDYDALRDAIPEGKPATSEEIELLKFLMQRGAKITGYEDCGGVLEIASQNGQFEIVALFLQNGADASELGWTDLMFAVALGTAQDVENVLRSGADLSTRDPEERTAWHLSIITGDVAKCQALLAYGVDRNEKGSFGCSPLVYAIKTGQTTVLQWLLEIGLDVDVPDKLGSTPLKKAVQLKAVEEVRILLRAGADISLRDDTGLRAFQHVYDLEILSLFLEYGEELNETNQGLRRLLLGLTEPYEWTISKKEYQRDKRPRFGTANPELINNEFWNAMVRSGSSSDSVCLRYEDDNYDDRPVWCYQRFGRSLTALPDGRYIEIGGVNEDWYDSNYCIYNDVFVHCGGGQFDIFGYPQEVFPPTNFHTATLVGNWIYIIGNLGDQERKVRGQIPVYRLNIGDYSIEEVKTTGDKPGWLSTHRAKLEGTKIFISGGKIYSRLPGQEGYDYPDNTETFVLDLETLVWSRVEE